MFYLLYLYYADVAHQYPLLNLVQYQTCLLYTSPSPRD